MNVKNIEIPEKKARGAIKITTTINLRNKNQQLNGSKNDCYERSKTLLALVFDEILNR